MTLSSTDLPCWFFTLIVAIPGRINEPENDIVPVDKAIESFASVAIFDVFAIRPRFSLR